MRPIIIERFTSLILMRKHFITECSALSVADNSFVENPVSFNKENILILNSENFINKNGRRFYESVGGKTQSTFSAKTRFLQSSPGTK